jgi:DNA-binding SARP family transcriptional activator
VVSDIQFCVLGRVEVLGGGRPVPLGGNTTLTLLAGLLTSPNRIVPVSRIIEWVWEGRLPDHPRAALHNGVSRLRRLLGGEFLSTHAGGYCLHADAGNLDLLRFGQLRAIARNAIEQGAAGDAMRLLDQAVGLWQEPLLSNVESAALYDEVVPRLTEQYLEAVEERASLYIRYGRPEVIVHDLSAVVSRYPFRERLVGHLMAALTRSGRRADAIAAYTALRRTLREELGIDPGAEVRDLLVGILREDPGVLAARSRPYAGFRQRSA